MGGHRSPKPCPGRHHAFLFALVLPLLAFLSAWSSAQTVIGYGQTVQGTIAVQGGITQYQFAGQSGDRIYLHVNRVAGLQPRFQIFRPDGTILTTVNTWPDNGAYVRAWLDSYTLPVTGTYTIAVSDDNGSDTGTYILTLQRSNSPAGPQPIVYGETRRDTISQLTQIRVFQFTGQAGDRVFLHVNSISGFQPRIQLFGPTGSLLTTVDTSPDTGVTFRAWLGPYALVSGGVHTIFIADDNGADTGPMLFTLQRSNTPAGARTIVYGETRRDTIALMTQIRVFQFTAQNGDRLALHVNRISGIQPRVQIFRPDGTGLVTVDTWADSNGAYRAWLDTYAVSPGGTYTIFIADDNGAETGEYIFTLQRSNNPANARTIVYGETRLDTISTMTQIRAFQFTAQAGDRAVLRVNRITGFQPRIQVYGTNGSILATVNTWPDSGGAYRAWLDALALPSAGNYTIFIFDDNGIETGTCILVLQRSNNPLNAPLIAYGETRRDTISQPMQIRAFQFAAKGGDHVVLRANVVAGFQPRVDLFGPDGSLIVTVDTSSDIGTSRRAWLNAAAIPSTGTCTVFIADDNGMDTGPYIFTVQRSNDPVGVHALSSGDTAVGRILIPTGMDAYSVEALPGDTVWAWVQRDSAAIEPIIGLYTYNGSRWLEQASVPGAGTISLAQQVVPAGGGVWMIVGDDNGFDTGRYRISVRVSTHWKPIVYGQTVHDSIVTGVPMRRYAFTGQEKDRVILHCNRTDRTLRPLLLAYAPTGENILMQGPMADDSAQARTWVDSLVLTGTGLHLILVSGATETEQGTFYLTLQRSNAPAYTRALSPVDSLTDSLRLPTQINAYPFSAKRLDTLTIVLRGDSLRPVPVLQIYRPDGTLMLQRGGIRDTSGRYRIDVRDSARGENGTYALMVRDSTGSVTGRYTLTFMLKQRPVAVREAGEEDVLIPSAFMLQQNYPNPFNPATTMTYNVPRAAHVRIVVYDVLGREVARPVDDVREPGRYRFALDGSRWASGAYLCVMQSGEFRQTVRALLVK